jgi:hypothetical protein
LIVHADNARPHTAAAGASQKYIEENTMIRAPHPARPYSPDLASSDFYLFGYGKQCLRRQSFEMAGELFSVSEVISIGIEKSTLDVVSLEWMQRLRECVATNCDYFEDT